MSYIIRIPQFEGPFDLLLDLVEKRQITITEIKISEIAEDYLLAIRRMQELDIRLASDFIRLAGTLLSLKSRSLIPAQTEWGDYQFDDGMDDDYDMMFESEDELKQRLMEYKVYKQAAERLADMGHERRRSYERHNEEELTKFTMISRDKFLQIAVEIMEQMEDVEEEIISMIYLDQISVEDKMEEVLAFLLKGDRFSRFTELLRKDKTRGDMVATFLALLELSRQGRLRLDQSKNFEEIRVELQDCPENDLTVSLEESMD
jgi:segregation and condensation protein A